MIYVIIVVILAIVDQITKYAMYNVANGEVGFSIPIISNFFHLTYVENHGMIFGLAQGKISVVTVVSLILIGYVVMTEFKNFKDYSKVTQIGISIIGAGAVGNMIDRIFRGYVIDMIDFRGIWHFVFNVADMYVHIGIYIIIIDYFLKKRKEKK